MALISLTGCACGLLRRFLAVGIPTHPARRSRSVARSVAFLGLLLIV
ncbi:hypothetical protein MXY24_000155 [Salmonella enterica]|nr:hypothetical protein [Salmonella enterica]EJC0219796.1 hypothetical protein [Salmonella enterica]EJC0229199.1 hypothetical protein [Salmonella enterica]EJC0365396.1 hypothetical protein [Salmonella enterica]EJC0370225.1 hypothetical protein [Salmonella enterica]